MIDCEVNLFEETLKVQTGSFHFPSMFQFLGLFSQNIIFVGRS